jgi:nitrite reductase/ring-hydroxylating ferredoxin subunit
MARENDHMLNRKETGNLPKDIDTCQCLEILGSRREFLAKACCLSIAALVSAGFRTGEAEALPVTPASADPETAECSYNIPSSEGASIDSENQVILVRNANRVYAFALACPHENTALRWYPKDGYFQCPRHKARYQPDGAYVSGRKTRDMDRFAVRLEGQKIIVDLNKLYRSDEQKAEWESAFATV